MSFPEGTPTSYTAGEGQQAVGCYYKKAGVWTLAKTEYIYLVGASGGSATTSRSSNTTTQVTIPGTPGSNTVQGFGIHRNTYTGMTSPTTTFRSVTWISQGTVSGTRSAADAAGDFRCTVTVTP